MGAGRGECRFERPGQRLQLFRRHHRLHALEEVVLFKANVGAQQLGEFGKPFGAGHANLGCMLSDPDVLGAQPACDWPQFAMALGGREEDALFGIKMRAALGFVEMAHVSPHALEFSGIDSAPLQSTSQADAKSEAVLVFARERTKGKIAQHFSIVVGEHSAVSSQHSPEFAP